MFVSLLLIFSAIVFCAGVGRLAWHIVRGPDARRRKALVTLLINREMGADGESPSRTARERREIKHAAWTQRQHTHSQTSHTAVHQGSWSSGHSLHSSGYHSSSHHSSFDSGGHMSGHH